VNWYASASTQQVVQVAPTSDLLDGVFSERRDHLLGRRRCQHGQRSFNGHAILDHLKENTGVLLPRRWRRRLSATYAFKTRKFDGNFDFLFFGDPQIGSSGNVSKDGAGWEDTLKVALAANPDAELLVSGGDQVETGQRRDAMDRFPRTQRATLVPMVATIGNHDVGGRAIRAAPLDAEHQPLDDALLRQIHECAGGDYWFIYRTCCSST